MKRMFLILLGIVVYAKIASGQEIDEFLARVAKENPEIVAASRLLEFRTIEARTGNTPPDPFVSGGIMPGNSDDIGSKKIWSISQSFSFPTKYLLQRSLNMNTIKLAGQEFKQGKLSVMLEAGLNAIDLVYERKSLDVLLARKSGFDRLRDAWKKMLDHGAATIIDYNRIVLELSSLDLQIAQKESEIRMKQELLMFMSGSDTPPMFAGYPAIPVIDADQVLNEKKQVHPSWLLPEMEYGLRLQQFKLSKSGSLPEFEIGVESENVNGDIYTGPFAGISLPLWSNSNRVKAASAAADHALAMRDAGLLRLESAFRNEYSRMEALRTNIEAMKEILESSGGTKYPDTALAAGEINMASYFSSVEALYRTEDRLLELERDYQRSLAVILDHRML